jgi:hypothetical protein
MKAKVDSGAANGYPHLITLGAGRNTRWAVEVANALIAADDRKAHAFYAPGAVDQQGLLTGTGRRVITEALKRKAPGSKSTMCMVWAADDCTYFMPDGTTVDGRRPPEGEPIYPEEYEAVAAAIRDVRYIVLPDNCDAEYVCIRRIDADHVEVSSGARVMLGHFDELPEEGPGSELRRYLDAEGYLVLPETFRGVRPTGIAGSATMLGPVQPDGGTVRIVAPWPQKVFQACEGIAGQRLPQDMLQAAWRAVDPPEKGMMLVGALEAA